MRYSQKIKEILSAREITQDKLSHEIGVSFAALNRWVNDLVEPRAQNKKKIDIIYVQLFENASPYILKDRKIEILKKCKVFNLEKLLQRSDFIQNLNIKMTYATNKLEGSTLTESEVRDVLYNKLTFSNRTLIEHIEAKNHETALLFVLDNYKNKISESYIKKLHLIMMNSIADDAGSYRTHNVRIVGSYVPTANHLSINSKMNDFIKTFSKLNQVDIFNFLATMHAEFEAIHPFSDGNGRVGRLMLVHLALQNSLLPILILPEYRKKYLAALQTAQLENSYHRLEEVLLGGVQECLDLV